MSDQVVQYELNLKDNLSAPVEKASEHVNHLEHNMESLGERVSHVAEAFGISFAIFKGIEFAHEGIEQTEKLDQASAQLQNTMENMGTFTQSAFDKVTDASKEFSEHVKFNQDDILSLQSQLRMVGNVGEGEMQRLTSVSADLATKMNMSLQEAGDLLSRGINSPEMARRVGMQLKIDPRVMEHIQNLARHGKEAAARMELLAAAESKVGGAAQAAFDADPLSRFHKTMYDIQMEVGELAVKFLEALAPALNFISKAFKDSITWMKEHKQLMSFIGYVLTGVAAAIITVTTVTKIWAAVQWLLNAAMYANPLTLIIVGIGALVATVIYCYKHFATFRAILWATWAVIKEVASLIGDAFKAVYHVIHGAFTFNWSEVKQGWSEGVSVVTDAAKRIGNAAAEGYKAGMADFAKDEKSESLIPKSTGKGTRPVLAGDPPKDVKTKATGSKSITINVQIKDLVGVQNINTTNLKESAGQIRDMIVKIFSGAVNDFQIVADH